MFLFDFFLPLRGEDLRLTSTDKTRKRNIPQEEPLLFFTQQMIQIEGCLSDRLLNVEINVSLNKGLFSKGENSVRIFIDLILYFGPGQNYWLKFVRAGKDWGKKHGEQTWNNLDW